MCCGTSQQMATYKIYSEVKDLISDYETRPIQIIEGLLYNQFKIIKTCEFYSNSKYLGGNKDELQREKPFYNIVNYRVTLAKVATDLDIKDVQIGSDDPNHAVHSMLLQREAYEWMKATNFAYFLNKFGKTRPKYGGAIAKKTIGKNDDNDETLNVDVVEWRNVATDQVDITGGAIPETHYFTPVELMAKKDIWTLSDMKDVIKASKKSNGKASKYDQNREQHNTDRIVVREVTGMFPKSYYYNFTDEKYTDDDEYEYSLQHYFYADISGKCWPLFCEELNQDDYAYMYLPWEEMEGRGLGRGIIEDSDEAQVWTNDAVINEKNAMDLGGKVVLKTTSKQVGNNILEIDNGRIFELEENKTLDVLSLAPEAIGEFNEQIQRWQNQANDATSSYDANSGKQPPSDTPYSQTALLNQVASKPFDFRREEAGIFLTKIFEKWIIPYLIKKLYKTHLLASDFTDDELEVIDTAFATYQANELAKKPIFEHKIITPEDYQNAIAAFKLTLKGKRRFLEIPEGFFDDIEPKITVLTTGEQKNKSAILQSLSTILGDVMKSYDPQTGKFAILENPVMARIFGTILELSGAGISPASLGIGKPQQSQDQTPAGQPPAPQAQPQQPQGQPGSPQSQQPQQPVMQQQNG